MIIRARASMLILVIVALPLAVIAREREFPAYGDATRGQSIGPGKVRLLVGETGGWIEFTTAWSARSLLAGGGILVFADEIDGSTIHVPMRPHGDRITRKFQEGAQGGLRAPAPRPDDDHDGRVDEDRVDGVDNDLDGYIDEDYAAIGDEMIVTRYASDPLASGGRLEVHQEAYAWSLPNLDGAIMIRVWVRNSGAASVDGVRVAAILRKNEPFAYSEHTLNIAAGTEHPEARMVSCSDPNGETVALVALPGIVAGTWKTGLAGSTGGIANELADRIHNEDAFVVRSPVVVVNPSILPRVDAKDVAVGDAAAAFAVSPRAVTLGPGDELQVAFALVGVASKGAVIAAGENALRTYAGDGEHNYIPPPLSMTPRVLWGNFRPFDDGEPGVLIEVDDNGLEPSVPRHVAYFSGIAPGAMSVGDDVTGHDGIVLRGKDVDAYFKRSERCTLKGRLDSGEFFELILRPEVDYLAATQEAERYWQTPEKLTRDLLLSSPNPFRNTTTITYEIPSVIEQDDGTELRFSGALETSVKVYNVQGRLVSVLVDEELASPGVYTTQWQAVDDNGSAVASGVYYVKLQLGQKYMTKRVILLK